MSSGSSRRRYLKLRGEILVKITIPYINGTLLIGPDGSVYSPECGSFPLSDVQSKILKSIISEGASIQDLASMFTSANQCDTGRVQQLITNFVSGLPGISQLVIDIPTLIDGVIVDRGWGGVSRHALDLWQKLNASHRVVLICAGEPLYGFDDSLADLLVTPSTLGDPTMSFQAFIGITRSILHHLKFKLLLFSHCAMAPYFFDISLLHPSILFGDTYAESSLGVGCHLAPEPPDHESRSPFIQELLYGAQEPWLNLSVAKAYFWTFKYAVENWFWTGLQMEEAQRLFPELNNKFRLILPLVDTEAFTPSTELDVCRRILFTTTSSRSSIGMKGLDPILKVLERLPNDFSARLVLNEIPNLPPVTDAIRSRLEIVIQCPKDEMINSYRGSLANCRMSQADTSPVSVLESMSCGVPTIVSPLIARNIPVILDGITGYVIEPDDVERLEQILLKLAADSRLRRRIGDAGRRAVLRYSLDNNMQNILRYLGGDNGDEADYRDENRADIISSPVT